MVEVKTGMSDLSPNQIAVAKKVKIPLIRFRVANVMASPKEVDIYWGNVDDKYLSRFNYDSKR